mmetsp:Transcript_81133/g.243146  ORF Transcript_81133/g.243146 Transcript_81133/m.243146 type:complete len:397 (+) Transcript_81133:1220-2410(+)
MSTTPVSSETRLGGSTLSFSPRPKMTKANSPPPASRSEKRSVSATGRPPTDAEMPLASILTKSSETVAVRTVGHSERRYAASKLAPVVMKKMPRRMPSNGTMSARICARKLVLARSTPAANAPAVLVSPSCSAIAPIPTATRTTSATKLSVASASATARKTRLSSIEPAARTAPKPTVALKMSSDSSDESVFCPPSTSGRMTRTGATARSCASRVALPATPAGRSPQPFSSSTGKTKADEESVAASASTSASPGLEMSTKPWLSGTNRSTVPLSQLSCPLEETTRMAAVNVAAVSPIWAPAVERNLDSDLSRSGDASRPSAKRRKRTPKSPSSTSASVFENTFKPCGPRTAPSKRNSRIGFVFRAFAVGATKTAAARNMSKSRPMASSDTDARSGT